MWKSHLQGLSYFKAHFNLHLFRREEGITTLNYVFNKNAIKGIVINKYLNKANKFRIKTSGKSLSKTL
jgi:hypothetical protein